jgi:hypothetical protein
MSPPGVSLVIRMIPRNLARVSVENILISEFNDHTEVNVVQDRNRFRHETFKNSSISP